MATSLQHRAANVLQQGGIIAHQTDTICGLACLPLTSSLDRLGQIKSRPANKAFILLASHIEQLAEFITIDDNALACLNSSTTQPTTWLMPAAMNVSPQLLGDNQKIAVRITHFAPIQTLCDHVGAIASTSANISNHPVCANAQQIRAIFGTQIDYIDPDQTPGSGKSSTIKDLSTGVTVRR